MTKESCNCIVCAGEFNPEELSNQILSKINVSSFKVCQACLESSDPEEDYRQVREIISNYNNLSEAKYYFKEAQEILLKKN